MKGILALLADGFEEIEAITVIDVLRRANVKVDLCSLKEKSIRGAHDIYVKSDITLENQLKEYDGLYLPGGMPGAKNLMEDERVQKLIKDYDSKGKLIAAICAAPIALNKAGVIYGKKVTAFPSFKDELINVEFMNEPVVVSGNIITSRGPATALLMAFSILEYLGCSKEVIELKEDMQYNFLIETISK